MADGQAVGFDEDAMESTICPSRHDHDVLVPCKTSWSQYQIATTTAQEGKPAASDKM